MKRFYFIHFVEKLEKEMFVSRSRCSVGSQRRISNKGWHQKGPNREMNVSYIVRGLWNYLNVRVRLSSRY